MGPISKGSSGSMAVDRDRLKWTDSDRWPNGGNGRDSGPTKFDRGLYRPVGARPIFYADRPSLLRQPCLPKAVKHGRTSRRVFLQPFDGEFRINSSGFRQGRLRVIQPARVRIGGGQVRVGNAEAQKGARSKNPDAIDLTMQGWALLLGSLKQPPKGWHSFAATAIDVRVNFLKPSTRSASVSRDTKLFGDPPGRVGKPRRRRSVASDHSGAAIPARILPGNCSSSSNGSCWKYPGNPAPRVSFRYAASAP